MCLTPPATRTSSSCTACPAFHDRDTDSARGSARALRTRRRSRSPTRCSSRPTRSCSTRPRTACTPSRRSWSPRWGADACASWSPLGGNALLERGDPPTPRSSSATSAGRRRARTARPDRPTDRHARQRAAGRPPCARERRRPGPRPAVPARRSRRADPGHDRVLAPQGFQNAGPGREIASVITQTLVAAADPAFADPTKFVGPVYPEADARRLAAPRGWTVAPDGDSWRRVVASPVPLRVVEIGSCASSSSSATSW